MEKERIIYLGIDQGSSSTKGVLLDRMGKVLAEFSHPVSIHHSVSGLETPAECVEQDPLQLLNSVEAVFQEAQQAAFRLHNTIGAIGLACQRSGVCAWDFQQGEVKHALITWADLRFQNVIDKLQSKSARITELTSLPVTAHYAAPKFAYLQKKYSKQSERVGTLDSFLIDAITNHEKFLTEDTMAARSMLYDIEAGEWHAELCAGFGVDPTRLPMIAPSIGKKAEWNSVPVLAMLGDQQAALLAACCGGEKALLNLGTIASLSVLTGNELIRHDGYVSSVLYSQNSPEGLPRIRKFLIEAVTNACGPIFRYIREHYKIDSLVEIDQLCKRHELSGAATLAFAPLGGSGSPSWKVNLPAGILHGAGCTQEASIRALVENVGNFIVSHIKDFLSLNLLRENQQTLLVSGGLSAVEYLLQYIADCTGLSLRRLEHHEATAIGAASAAMIGSGEIVCDAISQMAVGGRFVPRTNSARERYDKWCELRDRVYGGNLENLELL